MISNDRKDMNERFVRVFNMLVERGEVVKNNRDGKGMGDFAEKILGNKQYGHIIRAYHNPDDKRMISYTQARTLCREYGVNESYILEGEGEPFGLHIPSISTNVENGGNILYTSKEAFAGGAIDVGPIADEASHFALPGLEGDGYVAFSISGSSMIPIIEDGDMVICRYINSVNDIQDNEIYAVKSDGNLWIKYVQKIMDKGRVSKLKLISANHLENDPFNVSVDIHTRLYKVIRRVSTL